MNKQEALDRITELEEYIENLVEEKTEFNYAICDSDFFKLSTHTTAIDYCCETKLFENDAIIVTGSGDNTYVHFKGDPK